MPSTISLFGDVSPTMTLLGDGIKAVLDDYVATNRILVFQRDLPINKNFSKAIWQIVITPALVVTQFMHTAWNSTSKAGANSGAVGQSVTFATNLQITLRSFKSLQSEFDQLVISQGMLSHILGWVRPLSLNTIDENVVNAFIHWQAFSARSFQSVAASVSLRGNVVWNTLQGNICIPNHYNKNDIVSKLLVFSNVGSVLGITSDDFAFGAGNGLGIHGQVGDYYKVWDGGTTAASIFLK
jgi:hypothetical protein